MAEVKRHRVIAALAVSSFFSLSACGGDSTVEKPASAEQTVSSETTLPPNGRGVEWSAPLIGGGTYDLAQTPLERPVALWFWAPG